MHFAPLAKALKISLFLPIVPWRGFAMKRMFASLCLGLGLLSIGFQWQCARKRPVEKSLDVEGTRWSKTSFENGKKWLGKVTIVNNGSNSAFGFYGLKSDVQLGRFRFTKDYLQWVAAEDVFEGNHSGERILNAWSIMHTDVYQKVSNGRQSNVETENDQIPWDQKRFFRVNWDNAVISEAASFPFEVDSSCWSKKSSRLVDGSQEISDDAINFTLAVDYQVAPSCITEPQYFRSDFTHTIHYKYSFMVEPESKSYKPYVFNGESDPLFKKYGYFSSVVPRLNSIGRLENTFVMNRWDVSKTHTFYFAENFPEKYKGLYNDPKTGIFTKTNELFAAEGLPMRFEIKENDGSKKFGDIRYSFVQFIEEPDFQAPFGYGPSDAHPQTGEILGATSIIWISDLKFYMQRLKDTADRDTQRYQSSPLFREMKDLLQLDPARFTERAAAFLSDARYAGHYRFLLPDYTYGIPGSAFANQGTPLQPFSLDRRLEKLKSSNTKTDASWDATLEKARTTALNHELELKPASDRLNLQRHSTVWYLSDAQFSQLGPVLKVVDTEKAIQDILYRVAIHEFGHGLNLRHNFYGSVEGSLLRATDKDSANLKTTSVMDYMSLKDEIGNAYDWEAYDKAALIYAYSDGKIDKVRQRNAPFLYCSDEHTTINPLCNQFDSGAAPSEVLMSLIESYDDSYWVRNFRYGRAFWNTSAYPASIFRTMAQIKRFVAFYQQAFEPNDALNRLAAIPSLNPFEAQTAISGIRLDMDRTVLVAAAFYAAVIRQRDIDRSFHDRYDGFSGSLTQLGIAYDKIFASRFFLGDEGYPLNPNFASSIVSFVPLRNSGQIGLGVDSLLQKAYTEAGEMFNGYDNLGRSYFAMNAARYFDLSGERGAIELVRVSCFKKASFEAAFHVDADAYGTPARPLTLASFDPVYDENADPYFRDEPSVAVIRINSDFYVAGRSKNPYAANLILRGDANGTLNNFLLISQLTEGRVSECR